MQLRWPLPPEYREITTQYGEGGHMAIDIACSEGTPVSACHSGYVRHEHTDMGGNVIRLVGAFQATRYCHLSSYIVPDGEHVAEGVVMAMSGNTGTATTGPHLHLELVVNGVTVDPLLYLKEEEKRMKKTAIHYENAPSETQRQRLAASNLPVVKMVWPCDVIPGKKCISRIWIGGDGAEGDYIRQGKAGAQAYYNRNLPIYQRYPGMYWVSANEPSTASVEDCNALCVFLVEWARIMHAAGFKVAGPELGEGQPGGNPTDTAYKTAQLAPAIMAMDLFTLHAYYCPPQVMPNDIWHAVRYRTIFADLRRAGYNSWPPLVIDEGGIDRGVIAAGGGFRNIPITEGEYVEYIKQYDAELCKDPEVLGCTIYGENWNPSWASFSITGYVADQIFALAEGQADDLLQWAETIVIPINPQAALWQYIRARGWVPQSQEMSHDGVSYQWGFHDNKRTLCGWINGQVVEVYSCPN